MSNIAEGKVRGIVSESNSSTLLESRRERMQCFLDWLAERGAVFPFVRMEVNEKSRTIHANARIGKGVLIMHIPRPLMITEETVKASQIGKLVAAEMEHMSLIGYFSAFLLEAKRTSSFWKPYIDVLPEDFSTHPLFFSENELEELQGTYALRLIRDELKWAGNEYKLLKKILPSEMRFTHEEYLWAKCAIMSRLHHVVIGQKKTRALNPLADMPDHDADANIRWEVEASQGFIYTAKRDIEKDEVLTIDYRTTNNSSSFRIYGFCPQGEGNNKTEIDFPSIPSNHPSCEYAKNLGVSRGDKRVFIVSENHDSADAQALLSYLRLSCLHHASEAARSKAFAPDTNTLGFVNSTNEIDALTMLETACSKQLQSFPTTIEADEVLLQCEKLPVNLSNAIRVRLGEKRVLRYFQGLKHAYIQRMQQAAEQEDYQFTK